MRRLILVCVLAFGCEPRTPATLYREAAKDFASQCERTGVPRWRFRAQAAGAGCEVLVIQAFVPLDSGMIEAIHYARPHSQDPSVKAFSEQHAFRGVAYTDSRNRIWTFGAVTRDEIPALHRCE